MKEIVCIIDAKFKKSFSVLSPTPFNVRKLSPIGLFYRYNIVVNRLTTVIYFYFTVWIFFLPILQQRALAFSSETSTTIINTDYFCIISHHGIYGCNSNIFFAAATARIPLSPIPIMSPSCISLSSMRVSRTA